MKIYKSVGLGSDYVVHKSDTHEVVPDVVIVVPENDADSVDVLLYLGFREWSQKIEGNLRDMDESRGV